MSDDVPKTNDGAQSLGELFEDVTGVSTVKQSQRPSATNHPVTQDVEDLFEYLEITTRSDGLEDTVDGF